jgi:hypothetical protein
MTAGKAKILDTDREVVALHKDRFVFPVSIRVSRASGTGQDALFMGVLKVCCDIRAKEIGFTGQDLRGHVHGQVLPQLRLPCRPSCSQMCAVQRSNMGCIQAGHLAMQRLMALLS